jgi:hypothetical protein
LKVKPKAGGLVKTPKINSPKISTPKISTPKTKPTRSRIPKIKPTRSKIPKTKPTTNKIKPPTKPAQTKGKTKPKPQPCSNIFDSLANKVNNATRHVADNVVNKGRDWLKKNVGGKLIYLDLLKFLFDKIVSVNLSELEKFIGLIKKVKDRMNPKEYDEYISENLDDVISELPILEKYNSRF